MSTPVEIPLQKLLDALLDTEQPFPARYLYRLSDLDSVELKSLAEIWPKLPAWRKVALMEDVEQVGDKNTLLSFEALGSFAVLDGDPQVRTLAVRALWEYEEPRLASVFLNLLETDPAVEVRAAAAGGLGKYVYLGEVEDLPKKTLRKIEESLLRSLNGEDEAIVRRNALEALGYSVRKEVPALIEAAYKSDDQEWTASALYAMGRSCDEHWSPMVLAMLDSLLPKLREEAARAAGELEIHAAVPHLLELLDDPDQDARLAAIWSLSQLSGEGVREALEEIAEDTDDAEELSFIEEALDNLSFTEETQSLPLIDLYDEDDEEDIDWLDEDEDDEDDED
jgi:HEAT repeat protein